MEEITAKIKGNASSIRKEINKIIIETHNRYSKYNEDMYRRFVFTYDKGGKKQTKELIRVDYYFVELGHVINHTIFNN